MYDTATGLTWNSGLACNSSAFFSREFLEQNLFVFVDEAEQGGTDLNGDGDAVDDVLHWIRFP